MAINHLKLFMLAKYTSLPPFSEILSVFRGISCQTWVCKRGSALSPLVFVDKLEEEDSGCFILGNSLTAALCKCHKCRYR